MLGPTTLFSLLIFTCYPLFVRCQFDLDTNTNGTGTSLTYLFINSNSSLQLLPDVLLTITDLIASSITARVSTQSLLSDPPCFTASNTPSCQSGFIEFGGLSVDSAILYLQSVYYENTNPVHDRTVVVTVTVSYRTRNSDSSLSFTALASVLEKRDKPIISFKGGVPYAPVYRHDQRPVPFLVASNFALSSQGGLFTSLLVCVYTQTGLETLLVDSDQPNIDSPISIIQLDRVCYRLNFDSIDNTTLLQTFSAFSYSEKSALVSNYNDRIASVSVDSGTNTGDPLYFNISYSIIVAPTPITVLTAPVVYFEDVGTQAVAPNLSTVRISDVINITRQSSEDRKLITSLLLQSNSSHIPMVSLWSDQLCSTHWFSHPVHKFEFCSDEQFFFNLELTANFLQKFGLTTETILVEGRQLNIFNATRVESYGFVTLIGSETQTPDANHFSIWFKNAPGELMGCPLEITNGLQVDYQICLTGSESLIHFAYSGLAPEHYEVTVSYPTNGAFRLDDWNFVSVSVTRDSIYLLLNEIVLEASEFYWFDQDGVDYSTQIPVHLYSTSISAITEIYILGKNRGFIGEVTGVIVDQFYITAGEAHCMFSCIEGFYINETVLAALQQQGLEVVFVRESFEVTGNMSLDDVSYILQNVYYTTPLDRSRSYRLISVTASDDTFSASEVTRLSNRCAEGYCFENTYCYATDDSAFCLCREGYLDASSSADMSVCKHPMDCSYLNGGCSTLELCVQTGEEARECVDPCASTPCLNNGTCTVINATQYDCTCVGEFYGAECMCRNSCLSQDCSPGECIDYCNGTFVCTTPESSQIPTPSSTILSASTTSYVSSTGVIAVQSTYSPLYIATSQLLPATTASSFLSTQTPSSAPAPVGETVSSLFIASQTATAVSSLAAVFSSSVQIPASSTIPLSTSVLSQTNTSIQESTQPTRAYSSPAQSSTPVVTMATSTFQPVVSSYSPQYSQVVSSSLPTSSSLLTGSSTYRIVLPISSTTGFLAQTSSVLPTVSSSDLEFPDFSLILGSQGISIEEFLTVISMTSFDIVPPPTSSIPVTSQVVPYSSAVDVMTSSQFVVPTSTIVPTSSQAILPSSTADILMSTQVIPSSSVLEAITSSEIIPSSSDVEVVTSSEIPSSSVLEIMTSSQVIPSSSVLEIMTSSEIIPSSSVLEAMTSSQVIPSSSVLEIMTSSEIPSSSVLEIMTSSEIIPSSSVLEAMTSSQVIPSSSVLEAITSSEIIPSSSVLEIMTSSQVIPSSSDADAMTSSEIIPSSSLIDVMTSSEVIPSSSLIDVMTSSEVIPSSSLIDAMTSSEIVPSSSVLEVVTSSQIVPSSSVVQTPSVSDIVDSTSTYVSPVSSQAPDSSLPLLATDTSLLQSMVQITQSLPVSSSAIPSSPLAAQLSTVASSATESLIATPESSSDTGLSMPTTSAILPSSTPTATQDTTQPEARSNVAVGIGIALGIFLLILVIIASIALVFALFLFRMNRFQNLDPSKEFDKPDSTSPAQITAVYKNKDSLVLN